MEPGIEPNPLIQLIPMLTMQVIFAGAAWWISPKMGKNRWLWGGLFLIPLFGMVFALVFQFIVLGSILDRLNLLAARKEESAAK
jgi:hypothetical protein